LYTHASTQIELNAAFFMSSPFWMAAAKNAVTIVFSYAVCISNKDTRNCMMHCENVGLRPMDPMGQRMTNGFPVLTPVLIQTLFICRYS
jgi:hypothetical protein